MELSDIKIILKKRRSIEKDYRNYCKNLFKYLSDCGYLSVTECDCEDIFELNGRCARLPDYYDKINNQDDLSFEELLNLYYIVSKKYHNNSWFNFHCNSVCHKNECYGENDIRSHLAHYSKENRMNLFFSTYTYKGLNGNGENNYCIFCNNCNNCKNCINCNNCEFCVDCKYCNKCDECKNCNFSEYCRYCNECDYCDSGYHCEKCDHCYLVEQRKNKHFEQVLIA